MPRDGSVSRNNYRAYLECYGVCMAKEPQPNRDGRLSRRPNSYGGTSHGPTTTAVAAALTRLQGEGRWTSLRVLSATLMNLPGGGIKLSHTSIGQIVRGERHVTVDELTSLAAALGVSPITLLMPSADEPDDAVEVTGAGQRGAGPTLQWLQGTLPLGLEEEWQDAFETEAFRRRSLPRWAWHKQGDPVAEAMARAEEDRHEGEVG
jgi:hypothetical protein